MVKNFFSLILIAVVFLGNFIFANAQVQSNLPLVYVTEVNLEKETYKPGEILKGEIVLLSKNKEDSNNLNVAFSLNEDDEANSTGFFTELKKVKDISIKEGESKTIPFEFVLPNSGPNILKVKAQVSLSSGLPLGWEYSKNFNFQSNSSYLTLIATRVSLDNDVTYPTDYGPHIYRDKIPSAISVEALVKNTSDSDITVVPEIVVYKWPKTENAEEAKSRVGQSVIVKKTAGNVTISLPLPNFDYSPGVYEGVLYIKDEQGNLKTAEISFRYIVGGDVLTIHSLSTAKGELVTDELFEVKAFVTGTPPDLDSESDLNPNTNQNVSIELKVFNEKNNLVASEKRDVSLQSTNDIVFSLNAKKESKFLRGELTVSKDGKEIKKYNSKLSADFTESQSNVSFFETYFMYIVSVAVLFSLYLAYVFVFKKSLSGKAFVFALLLSLCALSYTSAFTLIDDTGYYTRFDHVGVDGVVKQEVFVNRPIEGQALRYGESFNIEGRVLYPFCSNSTDSNTTVTTLLTKGDGSILDLNSDDRPDYKHSAISTVLDPAKALPIGCETHIHCWYKPTRNFTDTPYSISSVMPYGKYRAYIKAVTKYTSGYIKRDFPDGIHSIGYVAFSVIPSSPVNVLAETGACGKKVKLSWDRVPGVTGYYVYRSTSATGLFSFLTSVSTTTFTNNAPTANRLYFYKVTAYHSSSLTNSGLTNAVSVNAVSSADCLPGVCRPYPNPVTLMPTGSGLCDFGVSSPVTSNLTSFDWTCKGETTLASACSAAKITPGLCGPSRVYNVDKCCPVALVAGTCPPPPSLPNISATTYCTPSPVTATTTAVRVAFKSAVGRLPMYYNLYSVSATSSFRTFVWTITQTTAAQNPSFEVSGLATSTNARYAVTAYNAIGQSSSSLMMYPIKTPAICPVCPDGVTPRPSSGICSTLSLVNGTCTFVPDSIYDPFPPIQGIGFSRVARAVGVNPPFTFTWTGDLGSGSSVTTVGATSTLRVIPAAAGLKRANVRVQDSAGNVINKTCDIQVYCPDGTLNCGGGFQTSISRIDNTCLFPTTKNQVYFNSTGSTFPITYSLFRKKTTDTSFLKIGTYIQNSLNDPPTLPDSGLPMSTQYTYKVSALLPGAASISATSVTFDKLTGFCSGTLCLDGSSPLPDGTCPSPDPQAGELELDELYVWPPRVMHGDVCKVYIRKVDAPSKKLFAKVPPLGANCSLTGPIDGSFPEGIDPLNLNTKSLFELVPTGEIYFISKPVTGTSLFEVNCDGLKISNSCKVSPMQSDTSFFEKIFKVSSNLKDSLVGALLFSLGFDE